MNHVLSACRAALVLAFVSASDIHAQTTAREPRTTGESPQEEPAQRLDRVEITGKVVKGYAASSSQAATKSDTPILGTPMAVQVVPRDVIEDRQERTTLEAVKNVSGVQSATYQFYDQFLIRGFDSGYGTIFRNGLQLRGINESVNMAFVDRVEVIKGPASMLYGRIEPGGFVNVVTRKPEAESIYRVEQRFGSWGYLGTTVDATGRVTDDGSLLYRVTGDLDKARSWVDNAHRDNKAVAASLTWQPTQAFDINLQIEHYNSKTTWLDASIPVVGNRPADLPRNFSILYPESWTNYPYTVNRTLYAFEWHYTLGPTWKLTQRFHYVRSREDQQGIYANDFDGVDTFASVRFTHSAPDWWRWTYGTNLDLAGEFKTGAIGHRLLAGVDWARFVDDTPGSTGNIPGAAPLNMRAPLYAIDLPVVDTLAATDSTNVLWRDRSKDTGIYVQDQIALTERWDLLLGGRYDWATDSYSDVYGNRDAPCYPNCTGYPVTPYPTDKAFSPRAGLLYKATDVVSLYASYSKSFGSANGRDNNGNPLKAQIGKQYEFGAKSLLLDGTVTASATLFSLTKSNIPEYDPVNFFPHVVGEARSRGLEIDIAGQVTHRVSVIGSYTYDQTIITNDPYGGTQGKRLSGAAPQVFSLWTRFDSAPGATRGWKIGAGVYASAPRQGDDNNTWQLPGYARVDALLAFRTSVFQRRLAAQFNVNNVFDRKYFDHGGYGAAAYGAPRTFIGAIRIDF